MEKFVIIEFEGDYQKVEDHIREKIPSIKSSNMFLFGSKVFITIPSDDHDDLFFFRNYEIHDLTKTKYVSVKFYLKI